DHVADDPVDRSALRNRHLRLCEGAAARDVDGAAAEKMQDAHAARPALLIGGDEFLEAALEPRRHHAAVVVPGRAEAIPYPRVAPQRPIFHEFADGALVVVDAHWVTGCAGEAWRGLARRAAAVVTTPRAKSSLIRYPAPRLSRAMF